MIFEKWLMPDLVTPTYREVTPELVKSMGGKALLCDVDNTLATYDDPTPPEDLVLWIKNMRENGVEVAFVSINDWDRIRLFNEELGLVAYAKSKKPSYKNLAAAAKDLGLDKSDCILLGDQLLTDCWAGKRFGIPAIIVPPIKDRTSWFFRFKRWLEKPYMKKYRKNHEK